jgi:hypothetical protein
VTGNPGLKNHTEDSDTPDHMAHTEDDFRSATWVAAVTFVVAFTISFYAVGVRM